MEARLTAGIQPERIAFRIVPAPAIGEACERVADRLAWRADRLPFSEPSIPYASISSFLRAGDGPFGREGLGAPRELTRRGLTGKDRARNAPTLG